MSRVDLKLLGLVSVIVVERDDWQPGMDDRERKNALEEVMKVASALEGQGAKVRPILDPSSDWARGNVTWSLKGQMKNKAI